MTPTFESPRAFAPSHSLLGRAFRAWTGDRLRGEALYIVTLTGLALLLVMSHYLGWALLKPVLLDRPSWQMMFWAGQLFSVCVLGRLGLVGFRPGVTVACRPTAVKITQGGRAVRIAYPDIDAIETVSATTFHRHYRRYAATTIFVSRLPDEVLLLRTAHGPVVVALADSADQHALRRHLHSVEVDAPEPVPQP